MNKGMLVSELRSRYPKALGIRKRLAKGRVMLIQKHIIPAEEAKWAEENKQQAEMETILCPHGEKDRNAFAAGIVL